MLDVASVVEKADGGVGGKHKTSKGEHAPERNPSELSQRLTHPAETETRQVAINKRNYSDLAAVAKPDSGKK